MHTSEKDGGFYTPEELRELKEQLDRGTLPGETAMDRETRAAEILHRKQIHPPQT